MKSSQTISDNAIWEETYDLEEDIQVQLVTHPVPNFASAKLSFTVKNNGETKVTIVNYLFDRVGKDPEHQDCLEHLKTVQDAVDYCEKVKKIKPQFLHVEPQAEVRGDPIEFRDFGKPYVLYFFSRYLSVGKPSWKGGLYLHVPSVKPGHITINSGQLKTQEADRIWNNKVPSVGETPEDDPNSATPLNQTFEEKPLDSDTQIGTEKTPKATGVDSQSETALEIPDEILAILSQNPDLLKQKIELLEKVIGVNDRQISILNDFIDLLEGKGGSELIGHLGRLIKLQKEHQGNNRIFDLIGFITDLSTDDAQTLFAFLDKLAPKMVNLNSNQIQTLNKLVDELPQNYIELKDTVDHISNSIEGKLDEAEAFSKGRNDDFLSEQRTKFESLERSLSEEVTSQTGQALNELLVTLKGSLQSKIISEVTKTLQEAQKSDVNRSRGEIIEVYKSIADQIYKDRTVKLKVRASDEDILWVENLLKLLLLVEKEVREYEELGEILTLLIDRVRSSVELFDGKFPKPVFQLDIKSYDAVRADIFEKFIYRDKFLKGKLDFDPEAEYKSLIGEICKKELVKFQESMDSMLHRLQGDHIDSESEREDLEEYIIRTFFQRFDRKLADLNIHLPQQAKTGLLELLKQFGLREIPISIGETLADKRMCDVFDVRRDDHYKTGTIVQVIERGIQNQNGEAIKIPLVIKSIRE
jgi:hypothetical protein